MLALCESRLAWKNSANIVSPKMCLWRCPHILLYVLILEMYLAFWSIFEILIITDDSSYYMHPTPYYWIQLVVHLLICAKLLSKNQFLFVLSVPELLAACRHRNTWHLYVHASGLCVFAFACQSWNSERCWTFLGLTGAFFVFWTQICTRWP